MLNMDMEAELLREHGCCSVAGLLTGFRAVMRYREVLNVVIKP
jgi:hypothetical protein